MFLLSVSAYEQPVWAKSDTPQLLAHMKCERPRCERTPPALNINNKFIIIKGERTRVEKQMLGGGFRALYR